MIEKLELWEIIPKSTNICIVQTQLKLRQKFKFDIQ